MVFFQPLLDHLDLPGPRFSQSVNLHSILYQILPQFLVMPASGLFCLFDMLLISCLLLGP